MSEAATAPPQSMASTPDRSKPSAMLGHTTQAAARYSSRSSANGTPDRWNSSPRSIQGRKASTMRP